jgi:hypothetical protein
MELEQKMRAVIKTHEYHKGVRLSDARGYFSLDLIKSIKRLQAQNRQLRIWLFLLLLLILHHL